MIKAIIFDCFGVLIGDGLEQIMLEAETTHANARRYVRPIITQVNEGLVTSDESSSAIAAFLGISLDEFRAKVRQGEIKNPELLAWILAARTTYKTAVLTNISRASLEKRFTEVELAKYFDVQIVSGEVRMTKPNPLIYQAALTALGVEAHETVFIDDRQRYLDPAKILGMHTILFKNNEQFYKEINQYLA